jgi:hypothetical protein
VAGCQSTFRNETLELSEVDDGTYRAVVQPALGDHAQQRLTGCLNDTTLDRLTGHIVAIDTTATPGAAATLESAPPT